MSDSNKVMPILDHLTELRKRLVIILVVNIVASLFCYQYVDVIMQYILNLGKDIELIYITPSELFLVYVKLSLLIGIVISSPITLLQIWLFVSKGLYKKEKFYIVLSAILGVVFFILGVMFCYFMVLPITMQFFVRITISDITAMISVDSFVTFINTMLICFGVIFELPIIVFLLSLFGLLTPKMIKGKHKYFIVIIFILAAFITPPDIVSQVLLGIPMVLLFQLSVGICWMVDRKKKKDKYRRV